MNPTTEQTPTETILSAEEFGLKLRQCREAKGLSVGEVSERLKLPARQIEALEKGQYKHLPEPVFIRGFLCSYARFVEFDETLLSQYLAHFSPPEIIKTTSGSQNLNYANSTIKKPFPKWIIGIVVVGIIGYGIYAWQSKSQTENARQQIQSNMASSDASKPLATNLNNANVLVRPMSASEISASSVTSASAPEIAQELVIRVHYRTMLTVSNGKGEVLINQIVPARSEHRFVEGAPFEVRLGYGVGVSASFAGKKLNVDSARKKDKTVAFTVGKTPSDTPSSNLNNNAIPELFQ